LIALSAEMSATPTTAMAIAMQYSLQASLVARVRVSTLNAR
jgi:hypothetical protein